MCGIVGVYEYARAAGGVSPADVVRMRDTLRHRGPDGEGLYVSPDARLGLGHRRLAIVDVAGGAQPMFGTGGECLVFNGEIYNYPALRRELEAKGVSFRTTCDTEVILHLYTLHGQAVLDFLTGMFAFALWDPNRRELFFARDRVGEKPLYWTDVGGRLLFASEIKALLAHPGVTPEVNRQAIPGYLANLTTSSPQTLYRGIFKLPPATMAICDETGMRVTRYWNLFTPRQVEPRTLPEATTTVRHLLDKSVMDRLMADVPVGVLLSGGLDSTTLVALLNQHKTKLPTFSVGFSEDAMIDEREEARWVSRYYGTEHHEVTINEQDALGFLSSLVHHQDEPLADPVCIPLHFVCQLARNSDVKVVLAGEGSDELFWGYSRYRTVMAKWRYIALILALPTALRRVLRHVSSKASYRYDFFQSVAQGRPLPLHFPLGLSSWERGLVLGGTHEDIGWAPSDGDGVGDALETLAFDTQEYEFGVRLPELLLMRIDRFSMGNSIEARVPFLDPELVEYAYRLPVELKLSRGVTKRVLREAVNDIVPARVLARPKQGFGAPISAWFASRVGNLFAALTEEEGLKEYFDVEALNVLLQSHRSGRGSNELVLWPLLNFALWHKSWIQGEDIDDLVERLAGPAPR